MSWSVVLRALALATLCGALAGCGSGDASKQDVIARGNAICAATLRSVRAVVPPTSGPGSATARNRYLQRVLPLVAKEVSQLRQLPRPATDKAILDKYIAAITRTGGEYRTLAAASRRNDTAGVARALAALRSDPAGTLAAQYGLTQCAGAAGTSAP